MTRSDLRPIQYLVYSSRTGIVLPVAPWKIRRCKGLSDLPQGAKLVCRGAGTRSQVGLTPGFSLPLTLNLFLLWPRPSPSFPHWALADRGSPHLPPTTAIENVSQTPMSYLLIQILEPSKAIIEIISPGQSVFKFDSLIKRCVVTTVKKTFFFFVSRPRQFQDDKLR